MLEPSICRVASLCLVSHSSTLGSASLCSLVVGPRCVPAQSDEDWSCRAIVVLFVRIQTCIRDGSNTIQTMGSTSGCFIIPMMSLRTAANGVSFQTLTMTSRTSNKTILTLESRQVRRIIVRRR